MAAYMTITTTTTLAVHLRSVTSPDFQSAAIHQSEMHHGMAHMMARETLTIEAGQSLARQPGGITSDADAAETRTKVRRQGRPGLGIW